MNGDNKTSGFTLIESLVAVSLFVIVVISATGLFLVYSRAQRESGLRQSVLNQLSLDLERIAQDIRLNKIIFQDTTPGFMNQSLYSLDGDSGIAAGEYELGFINQETGAEETYFFYPSASAVTIDCANNVKGMLYRYSATRCDPLFRVDFVTLTDAKFYIHPSYNPYPQTNADCLSGNFNGYYCTATGELLCHGESDGRYSEGLCFVSQPIVTISLTAQIQNDSTVTMQTSVSSRYYQ